VGKARACWALDLGRLQGARTWRFIIRRDFSSWSFSNMMGRRVSCRSRRRAAGARLRWASGGKRGQGDGRILRAWTPRCDPGRLSGFCRLYVGSMVVVIQHRTGGTGTTGGGSHAPPPAFQGTSVGIVPRALSPVRKPADCSVRTRIGSQTEPRADAAASAFIVPHL